MKYFTFEELCFTTHNVKNVPLAIQKNRLAYLVDNLLDKARQLYGNPIVVNSGFRSEELNRLVGGSSTSQHLKGEAVDITCSDNAKLFEIIKNNFKFDQLINENDYSWIHVSLKREGNRNQVLRFKNGKYELF